MKKISLGETIAILANLGVLAGIVFLTIQVNQANRIAILEARTQLVSQAFELQKSILEYPEMADLLAKLESPNPTLTPREQVQAMSYTQLIVAYAAKIRMSLDSGFMTKGPLQASIQVLRHMVRRSPGIKPFLEKRVQELGLSKGDSPAIDVLLEEMERL